MLPRTLGALRRHARIASSAMLGLSLVAACTTKDGATTSDAGGDTAPATCATPGAPTPGPADTHCASPDGGADTVQPTDIASCHPDVAAPDAGTPGCAYGGTMYGQESDDDDCKYHVKWTTTPICEGAAGVELTVFVTNKGDKSPSVGAKMYVEAFTTTPGDAACDNASTHAGPNDGAKLEEGSPGSYTGRIQFDLPGQWTLRFHFHGDCADSLPTSPHGHAAYHVTVP